MSGQADQLALSFDALAVLGRCTDSQALTACLKSHPEFFTPAAVKHLAEAVRHSVRVDAIEALHLADAALAIAADLHSAESLGLANRAKANALWYSGNLKPAIELYEAAVRHFTAAGASEEIGRTLSSFIQPLALLGEYERAFAVAAQARDIFRRIGDPWRMARLEINVANIHHRQDRFAEALASYEKAYQELLPHKDTEALTVALHNMAVCLISLNDFDKALGTYQRARELCDAHEMPRLAAQADYNAAYLYFLRGDYNAALEQLGATRTLCLGNSDAYHAALCDLDRSEIYLELNLSDEAVFMARRAEEQFESLGMPFETGRSIVNLAIGTYQQEDFARALDFFAKAAVIFDREKNAPWQALLGLYRALVLFETGQVEGVAELCTPALQVFHTAGLERRAILCTLLLARVAHARGQTGEALEHCANTLRRLIGLEAPLLEYHAHVLIAAIYRDSGERERSYQHFQNARLQLETLRSTLQREELKIAFMKNKLEVYENLVGICLEHGPRAAQEVFGYMEHAKSRTLLESPSGMLAWLRTDGTAGEHIRTLQQDLNWFYRRIEIEQARAEGVSVAQINTLWSEAREKEDEFLRTIRELPGGGQTGVDLRNGGPVPLDRIQLALGTGASLIEYFQAGSDLLAAIVTGSDVAVVPLGEAAGIAASITLLEFQLSRCCLPEFRGSRFKVAMLDATESRLHELYKQLIQPLEAFLTTRHIVVVPHGALHYLPFHALFDGSHYLIDRFTFSYAPSASMYATCHARKANDSGSSLIMGIDDERARWIAHEIRSVAAVVAAPAILTGAAATMEALRVLGPSCRLVHIATHATFRRNNPMFSSVHLADSYVNMYDLYGVRLPVELLTLSGCGTGLSVVMAGDELLGLARGLLATGAQSLLLSLWDVHDRTTSQFMACFYSSLRTRRDKAVSVQVAMQELRALHPHPYYWAPFVLIGKAAPSPD